MIKFDGISRLLKVIGTQLIIFFNYPTSLTTGLNFTTAVCLITACAAGNLYAMPSNQRPKSFVLHQVILGHRCSQTVTIECVPVVLVSLIQSSQLKDDSLTAMRHSY